MPKDDVRRPSGGEAMAWAGLTLALTKGTTVVATLVLARLLLPEDFGLFALGFLVINFVERIKDFGVGAGLVYRREEWNRLAGTGLTLSVISAVLLAAFAFAAAPLAAHFFDDPRATGVMRALSVVILVAGLAVVPESKMRRELDFRRRVIPEIAASVTKGGVSIALAYAGMGVYALVLGQVAGTLLQSLLYWALGGWRPRLEWQPQDARALLRYGLPSALVALFSVITDNIDYLVIGRQMATSELGYYVMAYRIPELSVMAVCVVAGQVFFPIFARLQTDIDALRDNYLRYVRLVTLGTAPLGVLIACVSPELVVTVYSDRWAPIVPVLSLLALFSVVYSLSFHAGEVYKATGRPGILNILAVVKIIVLTPALWLAAREDIVAVAGAVLAANVVLTAIKLRVVQHILHFPARAFLHAITPGLVTSAVLAVVVLGISVALPLSSPPLRLFILVLAGGAVMVTAAILVAPDLVRRVVGLVAPLRRRAKRTGPKS